MLQDAMVCKVYPLITRLSVKSSLISAVSVENTYWFFLPEAAFETSGILLSVKFMYDRLFYRRSSICAWFKIHRSKTMFYMK
jgi:hypothetical protein